MSFFHSFRAARWLRSTNLLLQALLFVLFFGGLNYLAMRSAWRFDLTQLRRHSLSAETRAYLSQLDKPVSAIVTFPKNTAAAGNDAPADLDQINNDINGLLREYTVALETNRKGGSLNIEYIDVYQRPRDAEQLDLKPNTILFLAGERGPQERRHEVTDEALYRRKNNQRVAFLGERAFTAAILDVSRPEPKTIYFLTGHGEMDLHSVDDGRGLSELRGALRDRNYKMDTLDFTRRQAIPADAELIVSIGAQNSYEPYEQEILRQYMSARAGRLMIFASPGVAPTGLEDLLAEWGIVADNDRIYDRSDNTRRDFSGDLILTTDNQHRITQTLADNHLALRFGATRSMRPDPARVTDPGLSITPLILTSGNAWGEFAYRTSRIVRYDPAVDLPGPLAVATVAERLAAKSDLPFSVPVGRIAAFGCSDFVANQRLGARANNILFFSTLNWLVGADDDNLNVPARPIERFQLSLSRDQFSRLRFALLLGAPGVFALLGIVVYWTRRR